MLHMTCGGCAACRSCFDFAGFTLIIMAGGRLIDNHRTLHAKTIECYEMYHASYSYDKKSGYSDPY